MSQSLRQSEWVILGVLALLVFSFIFLTKYNQERARGVALDLCSKEFLVVVGGAVKVPGEYLVEDGTTFKELFKRAKPLPDADLKGICLDSLIEKSMHLNIEELASISVSISGEIAQSVELSMPLRSRICDLQSKVIFTPETKKSFFRRRKLLRDGDKIVVPKK